MANNIIALSHYLLLRDNLGATASDRQIVANRYIVVNRRSTVAYCGLLIA